MNIKEKLVYFETIDALDREDETNLHLIFQHLKAEVEEIWTAVIQMKHFKEILIKEIAISSRNQELLIHYKSWTFLTNLHEVRNISR